MTDDELLGKVKAGLSIDDTDNDSNLTIKTLAVKQFILNSGVSEEQFESDLGIAVLTIGVNDIWDLTPGELKFSSLFYQFVSQLSAKSLT